MLTIAAYKNEKQVESYFEEHLSSGEYHTEKGQSVGTWDGKATEAFGLKIGAEVNSKDFSQIVKGINPKTGKSFLIRKKENRIVGREMLFSAPKSVSILAITTGDERLKLAHLRAVEAAFLELEKLSQTRIRMDKPLNSDQKRTTGNILAARFTHETSRELDPQLHTHNVVFNVTYDKTEGRLKALDPHFIYNSTNFISEVYRSNLAHEVKALGYEIEGGRHTWRIKGVDLEIEALFSKRSAQIDKAAKRLKDVKGVDVDTRGRALIAGLTRKAKDHEISESDYVNFQRSQLTSAQLSKLETLIETSKRAEPSVAIDGARECAKEAVDYALKHVFERASVVHRHDLIKEALKHAKGDALLSDIEHELNDDRFLHRGLWIMTREEREREIRIINTIRSGKRKFEPLLKTDAVVNPALDPEQKIAVEKTLKNCDQFLFIKGVAGAGKTFALSEINAQIINKNVTFLAPSGSATDTLRLEGFENAKTIQLFLMSEVAQRAAKDSVLIVDEAGLISTKQMDRFLKIVAEQRARVIFVGDTLQHNSVEGGDALRLIEDYSVIEKIELSKIRRQKSDRYREAIQYLAKGEVKKGFECIDKVLNSIHEAKEDSRFKLIANEYVGSLAEHKKTLIVCPTNDEITRVTEEVRFSLKASKLLGEEDRVITVYKSSNFTSVEKQYFQNYETNQCISFHKTSGEFSQGEIWSVDGITNGKINIKNAEKGVREIVPVELSKFYDVVVPEQKKFSEGEKILIKANYATGPTNRLPNGVLVQIEKFNDDGSIGLTNGKVLGKEFKHFTHGYAITSQSSQGKTADKVIVSASSKSGMALSRNQFYVSCSRGRAAISVYTDDKEKLKEAVIRSSSRKLVLEELVRDRIVMKRFKDVNLGIQKAVEKSRDLIDRAFRKWGNLEKRQGKQPTAKMIGPKKLKDQVKTKGSYEL